MKEKKTTVLMLLSIILLYITHRAVPFMMDDLWYSTNLSTGEPISSLWDIIESQIWHYHNWGGRSITHGILQLTLWAGENGADILNVLATLLLSGVICVVAGHRTFPAYFAAFSMLFGLNANWKMSMFWQAGAANYLYITSFILLFLYCYLREVREPKAEAAERLGEKADLPGIIFWIIPLGIMAGWSNENMGPAVWFISLLVMGLCLTEKRKIKAWMLLGSLSCLVGSILVIMAPGNFVRSAEAAAANNYGWKVNLFMRFYSEGQAALNFLFPPLLLLAAVCFLGQGVLKLPLGRKNILLLICALLSWGAFILSPHYPDRATFGTMVLMICVILSVARDILRQRKDLGPWLWGVSLLVWARGMFFLVEFIGISRGWIH